MQLLCLIKILIFLLYLLVSIDLVYTELCESVSLEKATVFFKFNSNYSGIKTTNSFNTYKEVGC